MKKLSMDELDRLSVEEFKKTEKSPIVLVLDNVRSLNNVGSAFRTADAFRIEKIYLCGPLREIWSKCARGSGKNSRSAYSLSDTGEAEKIDDGGD